jgi:RNA polymerase sigma-70 factor (ECF subfamily)
VRPNGIPGVVVDREGRAHSLYARHQPDLLAYFLRRLPREDAVEATADVFVTMWRRIGDVPDGDAARPWLFGVARNVLSNQRRGLRRRQRLIGRFGSMARSAPPPEPEVVVVRSLEDGAVLAALGRLRPIDREVLTLRLWEELSFEDVSAVLGCSPHAAEQRYARALQRFRSVWYGAGHVGVTGTERSPHGRERMREE